MGDTCVVCHRRDPAYGTVCTTDVTRIADGLRELLRKINALRLHLVPTARPATGRIGGKHIGAPMPARLDVLSLAGPGAVTVTALLHPLVRRWSTTTTVTVVTRTVAGRQVRETRQVTDWHRETVVDDDGQPVLVADDDQVGLVPPAEWLAAWVQAWRDHFGHARPVVRRIEQATIALDRLGAASHATGQAVLAWAAAVEQAYRRNAARTVLGLTDPTDPAVDDPVVAEWTVRFGDPGPDRVSERNVKYLLTWLDRACADDVGIADLAAELGALNAELTRTLGEEPDQQWLGRCPTVLTRRTPPGTDGGRPGAVTQACGAGLWQDPHASQVRCRRCHSTWGPGGRQLLQLAADIRRTWPIDRRRRYTTDEASAVQLQECPGCLGVVFVDWADVTEPADTGRRWRPVRATCTQLGCVEAAGII